MVFSMLYVIDGDVPASGVAEALTDGGPLDGAVIVVLDAQKWDDVDFVLVASLAEPDRPLREILRNPCEVWQDGADVVYLCGRYKLTIDPAGQGRIEALVRAALGDTIPIPEGAPPRRIVWCEACGRYVECPDRSMQVFDHDHCRDDGDDS